MIMAPEEVAENPGVITPNCTTSSCPELYGVSGSHLTVYVTVAVAFLTCAGLAVWWRRKMRNRRRGQFKVGARSAQPRTTPPDLGRTRHHRAASESEPDPDHYGTASTHYENVMVTVSSYSNLAGYEKTEQEYMGYNPPSGLADEDGIYDNDVPRAMYCNHPMQGLVQDEGDGVYVFPDQLILAGMGP